MPERKKSRRLGIFLVVAVAVVADLFAIASGQAVTTKFPQPLHLIQQYPWPSVAIFTVIGVVLAVLVFLRDDAESGPGEAPASQQGGTEVIIKSSRLDASAVTAAIGTRVKILGSKLKHSPVKTVAGNPPSGSS